MLFNSLPFLAFIAIFFGIWPLVRNKNTWRWLWICCMSMVFYGWWDWRFLFLLFFTGAIDYLSGKFILKFPSQKKFWLWLSLATNIGSLVIFKYSGWLASLLDSGFGLLNMHTELKNAIPEFTLVLPVGISFYTFNSMSYTIDLYRGKTKPAENILHFFAFISFFPHLVAGPIIRAKDILTQLTKPIHTNTVQIFNGIRICVWGLFQKMVLADNIAVLVNDQFNQVGEHSDTAQWWLCMLAFAFQIYFDFNGYSTIARGIAKLCGIHFRLNFSHPYFANSFQNFWQRWHISLSSFFRDYVYISLGGNRKGKLRTNINLWITMLLSGIWHGANFTFVIWGALHALYLSIERVIVKQNIIIHNKQFKAIINSLMVFIPVLVAWTFFRAKDMHEALYIVKCLFSFHFELGIKELLISNAVFWLFIGIINDFILFKRIKLIRTNAPVFQAILISFIIAIIIFFRGPEQQFIYFQF
ncbi:MAG: MBOAT family protein [bacterium]|nr:MBOAT family protein [bacterium]